MQAGMPTVTDFTSYLHFFVIQFYKLINHFQRLDNFVYAMDEHDWETYFYKTRKDLHKIEFHT